MNVKARVGPELFEFYCTLLTGAHPRRRSIDGTAHRGRWLRSRIATEINSDAHHNLQGSNLAGLAISMVSMAACATPC